MKTLDRICRFISFVLLVILLTIAIEVARASASKSYRTKMVLLWEARHPVAYVKMMTNCGDVNIIDIFIDDPVITFKAGVSAMVGSIIEESKKEEARRKKYLGG